MKRNLLSSVVVGFVLAAMAPQPAAASKLTICNRSSNTFMITMIERYPFLLTEVYESSGWHWIEPNQCREWSRGRVNTLYLLSVTERTDRGRRVSHYGVEPVPDWHRNTGAYGMQEFYCVKDERHGRRADSPSAYRRCQSGEYLQLFNLHVFVEYNSSYTLNLR